ncbi:hypothetical protein DEV53_23325 [Salmonella enterica]|nr:hypothetical protein [Salmonella enterica]
MNLDKLMEKHSNSRMTRKHFKAAENIVNHITAFIDGQESNVKRTYNNKIRELRNNKSMPDSTKSAIQDSTEIDYLAANEILSIIKMNMDEAIGMIKKLKEIHTNREDY